MQIKNNQLLNSLLSSILAAFILGFISAWIIRALSFQKLKKSNKSIQGFLESERLVKETLRKENALAFQLKKDVEISLGHKLKEAESTIKTMDENILLLQKSNELIEAEFKAAEPELYQLKMKLIEANNTISRLKAQLHQSKIVA